MRTRGASFARTAARALVLGSIATAFGCLDRPIEPIDPSLSTVSTEKITRSRVDKIDLLLMVDNSLSMADKQKVLNGSVADLVQALVNPPCVNDDGSFASQPSGPKDKCKAGTDRRFDPVLDIHVGMITSSLGTPGSKTCPEDSTDDHGHLVWRADELKGGTVPTYQGKGFLAWDPNQRDVPPGIEDVGGVGQGGLIGSIADLVSGAGEHGCGLEAQLESWYRFLVDPTPAKSYSTRGPWKALEPSADLDLELLKERRDFLRDDSLLAIVMLTDENDCSISTSGVDWMMGDDEVHMFRARSECAKDPNDPCCMSCARPDQGTCPRDPTCYDAQGHLALIDQNDDDINLRCWDQKRRFGENFLYSIDRYVQGLTASQVTDVHGQLVPNPLFSPLHPETPTTNVRTPDLVFLAGIVGVPWQDIARRDATGKPDLLKGLNARGDQVGGFMSAEELSATSKNGPSGWDVILGDPASGKKPVDDLMVESNAPRGGKNPVTGEPLAPAASSQPWANSINGHEYHPTQALEYACMFDLPKGQTETCISGDGNCDCGNPGDNPLCQKPDGSYGNERLRAKGYPGIRELQVLKGLGAQGIVGSVCPAQLDHPENGRVDYGYRPTVAAIIDRLTERLANKCLSLRPRIDDSGHASCLVIEAKNNADGSCLCNEPGRQQVSEDHLAAEQDAKRDGYGCFCEVTELTGDAATECRKNVPHPTLGGNALDGWCYVDPAAHLGEPALVSECPTTEQREIRFVGGGHITEGAVAYVTCKD